MPLLQFDKIDKAPAVDFLARAALATRRRGDAVKTIQRLGEDARNSGFPHPACAGEQIGVMQTLFSKSMTQGLNHMFLPITAHKASKFF